MKRCSIVVTTLLKHRTSNDEGQKTNVERLTLNDKGLKTKESSLYPLLLVRRRGGRGVAKRSEPGCVGSFQ